VKHHLNTLYITTQGAYLAREGQTLIVRIEGKTRLRIPIHTIDSIVCFGRVGTSIGAITLCSQNAVTITHLSKHGRFLARLQGPTTGNILLRREQYRRTDDPNASAAIARNIVAAKIANSRTTLQRALRDHPQNPGNQTIRHAITQLNLHLQQLNNNPNLQRTRGIEGDAARTYFATFNHLITTQKQTFTFTQRTRRPPLDPLNALLSFTYTLLLHDLTHALETVGLDPQAGFLHTLRPGRPSLALDLMEELRPFLADRLTLTLINTRQLQPTHFTTTQTGAVWLTDNARKTVLLAYQKRKQQTIQHPYLGEKTTIGLIPHIQALLLARHIRGDLDAYPPFISK